jgi:hypothetical protein
MDSSTVVPTALTSKLTQRDSGVANPGWLAGGRDVLAITNTEPQCEQGIFVLFNPSAGWPSYKILILLQFIRVARRS